MALLLSRGPRVRALVRTRSRPTRCEALGAQPVLADLRGDVEWTADGCDAAIFAAGARHRSRAGAIDAGGAAKLAEAADRYELRRFVLCSAVGAGTPERREGAAARVPRGQARTPSAGWSGSTCRGRSCASAG